MVRLCTFYSIIRYVSCVLFLSSSFSIYYCYYYRWPIYGSTMICAHIVCWISPLLIMFQSIWVFIRFLARIPFFGKFVFDVGRSVHTHGSLFTVCICYVTFCIGIVFCFIVAGVGTFYVAAATATAIFGQ